MAFDCRLFLATHHAPSISKSYSGQIHAVADLFAHPLCHFLCGRPLEKGFGRFRCPLVIPIHLGMLPSERHLNCVMEILKRHTFRQDQPTFHFTARKPHLDLRKTFFAYSCLTLPFPSSSFCEKCVSSFGFFFSTRPYYTTYQRGCGERSKGAANLPRPRFIRRNTSRHTANIQSSTPAFFAPCDNILYTRSYPLMSDHVVPKKEAPGGVSLRVAFFFAMPRA